MKLEDQVASLELSKRLKELGVRQESEFYWKRTTRPIYAYESKFTLKYGVPFGTYTDTQKTQAENWLDGEIFAAFTVSELGTMLPKYCASYHYHGEWACEELKTEGTWGREKLETQYGTNEAEVRAKMLVHLIETGVVKP